MVQLTLNSIAIATFVSVLIVCNHKIFITIRPMIIADHFVVLVVCVCVWTTTLNEINFDVDDWHDGLT